MNREQFTFYRSFWDALRVLPKKEQLSFALALCAYALDGEEMPLSGAAAASFVLAKPVLDAARRKAESGKQGGSKPKAAGKQTQANRKQTGREKEGEKEKEKEKEREKEVEGEIENESYNIPPSPSDDGEDAPPPEEGPQPGEGPLPEEGPQPEEGPLPGGDAVVGVAGVVTGAVGELSPRARAELEGFARDMGEGCIRRALDAARDAGKVNWGYIRGILRRKQGQGVRNAQDWDSWEASHAWGASHAREASHAWGASHALGRQGGRPAIAGSPRCAQPDPQRVNRNSQWLDDFLSKEEGKA